MAEKIETVIIGAGQAGLAASYRLSERGREHVVLERASRAGHVWRDERWDSFTLVTPNWSVQMPGAEYSGDRPDAFMPRDEVAAMLESYAERFHLPLCFNTTVSSVERQEDGSFLVSTSGRAFQARNVVVATGRFQEPKIPPIASQLPPDILQLASRDYRNPESLPPGAVLVVGSGQTGCQIVEDLHLAGRQVYLSVGSAGRIVRRYRGKDIWRWLQLVGYLDRTAEMLPSPMARFATAPHLSGARGGHSISLHQFARDGILLLGHFQAVDDGVAKFKPDLAENMARADEFMHQSLKQIDGYIARQGLDAPMEEIPGLNDDYVPPSPTELDLREAGITSVIWAGGFGFDYRWVKPAVLDEVGYPRVGNGPANAPGLYFVGLPWLPRFSTALLSGIGEVATAIADDVAERASQA